MNPTLIVIVKYRTSRNTYTSVCAQENGRRTVTYCSVSHWQKCREKNVYGKCVYRISIFIIFFFFRTKKNTDVVEKITVSAITAIWWKKDR